MKTYTIRWDDGTEETFTEEQARDLELVPASEDPKVPFTIVNEEN